jgi:ArsR family transcriptional regulator
MRTFVDVAKALADESRVRILVALRGRELCVCQIVELLGLAPSTVSKHVSILRQADLVESRKHGRWVYYRRAGRQAPAPAARALAWVDASAREEPWAADDSRRLASILEISPEELCLRMKES